MAKTKKRASARKKGAKRGKASVKPARKKTTTRETAKRAKSKVGRTVRRASKSTAEEKPASAETKRIVVETTIETSGVTAIAPPSSEREDNAPARQPDISSELGELPEQKVA